jgi:Ca2+-binding RTX toxin-like protein
MATANVGAGFSIDMTTLDVGSLLGGTITAATPHLLQIAFDAYDFVDFVGNFTYGADDVFGTLEQIRDYSGGSLWFSVGNFSVNANAFENLALSGNSSGALSLVLAGNDVIRGGALDDVLLGYGGNDAINGGGGDDILKGMAGNDRLIGGPGNDILIGGPGHDTFVFRAGFNNDVITDFTPGTRANHDTIELHSVPDLNNFAELKAHATVVSGHVVISDTIGDTVTLNSVHTVGQLHGYDFHFLA